MKNEISEFKPPQMTMFTNTFEIYHYREPFFHALDFHNHDFYEIYVFLDGLVTYYIEEKVYDLCAGDILVIPPGKMHRPVITDNHAVYERIVLSLNTEFIRSLDDEQQSLMQAFLQIEQNMQFLFHVQQADFEFLTTALLRLFALSTNRNDDSLLLKKSYIILLLSQIIKLLNTTKHQLLEETEYEIIPEIINYINEHLSEKMTLDELSSLFFTSKYHLLRKFKEYTNATIYDYIIAKRIVLAKKLIREGVCATNACMQCGFSDYSNFYKSFQTKTGMTPSAFKSLSVKQSLLK